MVEVYLIMPLNKPTTNRIDLEHSSVWIDDDNVLRIDYRGGGDLDIHYIKSHTEAILKVCNGIPRPFLIDLRDVFGSISYEGQNYLASYPELTKVRIAQAIVIDNLANRLLGNFYFSVLRPKGPRKIFNSVDKAKEWLMKQYVED